jgi:hypothetical protein
MIFQIDTNGLGPGDTIAVEVCEQAIGRKDDNSKQWTFDLLKLLGVVQTQLKKEHQRELTVRISGNELHILTDSEAAKHNPKRFDAGLDLARRSQRRLLAVDWSKLTPREREETEKNQTRQAFLISLMRTKEPIKPEPHIRTTPVMTFTRKFNRTE